MEKVLIHDCRCWIDESPHTEEVAASFPDGVTVKVPVRCLGEDFEPLVALPTIAEAGLSYSEMMPVSAYWSSLSEWGSQDWIVQKASDDESREVTLLHGSQLEALNEWIEVAEDIAPGTRRYLAALITGRLEEIPRNHEGSFSSGMFTGDIATTHGEMLVSITLDGQTRELLNAILSDELEWITSDDTGPDSWNARRAWWLSQQSQ
jgi:hypothetical protein